MTAYLQDRGAIIVYFRLRGRGAETQLYAKSAPSPIFVAGTGRSGTSQLADVLGEHPQIHRIQIDTRFIVDPGGLRDLADALTFGATLTSGTTPSAG
ncbi:hypothetical protein AAH979_41110 [Plantactinospora sp. ZYX-F-223]|uniref:hypothetical protein n=1 Tax=Plantactinospora sp. ZYX-F-223 TaxID=3144103 RepID=UPI0031FD54FF